MKFELFGKVGCAQCKSTKDKLNHLVSKSESGAAVAFVDLNTIDGRAEGAFNDVLDVPTVILRGDAGEEVARWAGKIPPSAEVQAFLAAGTKVRAVP
jgi:glutaredoxin